MRKNYPGRDTKIAELYASGEYLTEQIAKSFNLTPRRVQQIAKANGVLRNLADANRIASPLKRKRRISRAKMRIQIPRD
jgi:hypothetical protein